MSDRVSRFIQNEIDKINDHLPQKTLSLRQLQKMKTPGVKLRDGFFATFDNEELERIKLLIPQKYWGHVLLPIIITRRRDLGRGAYQVGGSDANLYIIESIFDELPTYEIWKTDKVREKIFYKPEIRKIRKNFPTTTVIAFS